MRVFVLQKIKNDGSVEAYHSRDGSLIYAKDYDRHPSWYPKVLILDTKQLKTAIGKAAQHYRTILEKSNFYDTAIENIGIMTVGGAGTLTDKETKDIEKYINKKKKQDDCSSEKCYVVQLGTGEYAYSLYTGFKLLGATTNTDYARRYTLSGIKSSITRSIREFGIVYPVNSWESRYSAEPKEQFPNQMKNLVLWKVDSKTNKLIVPEKEALDEFNEYTKEIESRLFISKMGGVKA